MSTEVFDRMNEEEFNRQWPKSTSYEWYTRVLLVVTCDEDQLESIEKELHAFVERESNFKLAFIKTQEGEEEGDMDVWVYIHLKFGPFGSYNWQFIELSSKCGGLWVKAIDIDNRIYQSYCHGDMDSGMYEDMDPDDIFESVEYLMKRDDGSVDSYIEESPIKIA